MKVFVTGATGFIGFAIVKELLAAGHQVTGLARSEASGRKLVEAGARVQVGMVEDLDGLRRAAAAADGAIHTAFYHKVSHMPLGTRLRVIAGGMPSGIMHRFVTAAVTTDRQAVEAIAGALSGSATEDEAYDPDFFTAVRGRTEDTLQALAAQGLRTSAIRLPPIVHGDGDHGFAPQLIQIARKKKESAYVGDGLNRWPSVHRDDAARLFRLALEKGPAGGTYHGVAEEGIPFRGIAGLIGRRLSVPVANKSAAEASKYFGFLSPFIALDNPTSSRLTQERLGWSPTQTGLLADLDNGDYFNA
jgi:nucleoside-diphosphate-sugar epimerase